MRKTTIKLERVTGVVALAYLLLIPLGAFYAWQRVQMLEVDVSELSLRMTKDRDG